MADKVKLMAKIVSIFYFSLEREIINTLRGCTIHTQFTELLLEVTVFRAQ